MIDQRILDTVINCKWKSADQVAEAIDTALRALYDGGAIPKGNYHLDSAKASTYNAHA